MQKIIFTEEYCKPENLHPFTYTRHIQDIRVGILTIREKWERYLKLPSADKWEDYYLDTGDSVRIDKQIGNDEYLLVHANVLPTAAIINQWLAEARKVLKGHEPANMVTLRVGELLFKKPVKTGNHIRIYGEVVSLGNTSITLKIEVRKYNLYSGEEAVVCTTNMTFVRIDDDGSPTPIGASVRKAHKELMAALEN